MVSGSNHLGQPEEVQVLVLSVIPIPSMLMVNAGGAAASMSSRVTTSITWNPNLASSARRRSLAISCSVKGLKEDSERGPIVISQSQGSHKLPTFTRMVFFILANVGILPQAPFKCPR